MVALKIILLMLFVVGLIMTPLWVFLIAKRRQQTVNFATQRTLGDFDLLHLIQDEPDRLISAKQLADKTNLTKSQARQRLLFLAQHGLLNRNVASGNRSFFNLVEPLPENPGLSLSPEPFLTVEDLLDIFEAYDGRVTVTELIVATKLPLDIILREMKHFKKEGIVESLRRIVAPGTPPLYFYTLQEPYRSDPSAFRARAGQLDLALKEMLVDEKMLV